MAESARWNERLQQCRNDRERKRKWERQLKRWDEDIRMLRDEVQSKRERLQREEADVERLKGASFYAYVLSAFGRLDEKLAAEEREAAEAKLKHDLAAAELAAAERERAEIARLLGEVADADRRYAQLMAEKETWMRGVDAEAAARLEALAERAGSLEVRLRELQEAIAAGESVRTALDQAAEKLGSAQRWGTYDMFGGGLIATAIKHGRIDDARERIHEAQHRLRKFGKELADVNWPARADGVSIDGLLTFADYFFDGFLTDWIVQGKINASLESVQARERDVARIVDRLRAERGQAGRELDAVRRQYETEVERYGADDEIQ